MRHIFVLCAIIFTLTSCESRNELPPEVLKTVVTIHTISQLPVKGRLFDEINIEGQKIYISRRPILTNKQIVRSEPVQYTDDKYGLKLQLTFSGGIRWQQASVEHGGMHAVMKIGGQFKCFIKIARERNLEDVRIATPFSKEEAEKVSQDIIRNYIAIKEKS